MRHSGIVIWCLLAGSAGHGTDSSRAIAGGCEDWRAGPLVNSQALNGSDGAVHALYSWDPDGAAGPLPPRLVAGGTFTRMQSTTAKNIAWLDPATAQWQPFGNPTTAPFTDARAINSLNNELITGWGTTYPLGDDGGALRWDGSTWHTMGLSGCVAEYVNATANFVRCFQMHQGALFAGGDFTGWSTVTPNCPGGTFGQGLARWDGLANWRRDPMQGFQSVNLYSMTSYAGLLIAAGDFTRAVSTNNPGYYIGAWDGANWNTLNGGANTIVRAVTVHNGDLIAAGDFSTMGGVSVNRIARWNGGAWQTLGNGLNDTVHALTVYNGQLIAAGAFTEAGGQPAAHIARWNGSAWQALGTGIDGVVEAITVHNGELIVGGDFTSAGGNAAFDIARWDGTQWSSFGGGSAVLVQAFTVAAGKLFAGGDFHQSTNSIQQAHNIAMWDGVSLVPMGSGMNSRVYALTSFTNAGPNATTEVIAGGSFSNAGGNSANCVARWIIDPVSSFPPPQWHQVGAGLNNTVAALARFNGTTVAGGYFTASGATTAIGIARLNSTTGAWGPMGGGMDGPILALKSYNSSATNVRLVAGGTFNIAGSVNAKNIAMWTESTVTPGNPAWVAMGQGLNGTVRAIEYHNGSIYAAGDFTASGAALLNHLARWTGSAWVAVLSDGATGLGFDNTVWSLRSINGWLYAGGDFTSIEGHPARRLARYNGTVWEEVQGGADDDIFALAAFNNELHVGGWFNTVRNNAIATKSWARYFLTGVPWIAYQPTTETVTCNQHAYFYAVPAVGYGGLEFVWRKNGVPLASGPTGTGSHILNRGPLLDILYPSIADEGVYELALSSDGCGSVISNPATLDVIEDCHACPADANHDRMVSVADLLLIITNWGACPPLPPIYTYAPPCIADVTADGQIDVADLLEVITSWGACP